MRWQMRRLLPQQHTDSKTMWKCSELVITTCKCSLMFSITIPPSLVKCSLCYVIYFRPNIYDELDLLLLIFLFYCAFGWYCMLRWWNNIPLLELPAISHFAISLTTAGSVKQSIWTMPFQISALHRETFWHFLGFPVTAWHLRTPVTACRHLCPAILLSVTAG